MRQALKRTSPDNFVIPKRSKPLCAGPVIKYGSKPVDDGNFILTDTEKTELIAKEPKAKHWIKRYIGSEELINGGERWCLWLDGIPPQELRNMPLVMVRIENIKKFRQASKKVPTREAAAFPTVFAEPRQPTSNYLAIPEVSSENRIYIPIGFLDKDTIASNLLYTVPNATAYHFGILTSAMHMAWMKTTCGRLESRYRYSAGLAYNTFPWPTTPTLAQTKRIEEKAQAVLNARAQFPSSTLADLYDPLTMPPALLKAHQALDKVVDTAYRKQPFASERERIEYLFGLYESLSAPLISKPKKKRGQ